MPQLTCEVDLEALGCLLGILRQGVTQVLSGSEISPADPLDQLRQSFDQSLLRLLFLKRFHEYLGDCGKSQKTERVHLHADFNKTLGLITDILKRDLDELLVALVTLLDELEVTTLEKVEEGLIKVGNP